MLRPTDEIAPDGFRILMPLKDYDPKELIADEKLLVKCMSELIGHEINLRKVIVLSEYRYATFARTIRRFYMIETGLTSGWSTNLVVGGF